MVRGLDVQAPGPSEEGRYSETADAETERVEAILPDGPRDGTPARSLLEWTADLRDAGTGEALAAFGTLVRSEVSEAANNRRPMACHLQPLIGYAQMLDTFGRGEPAALARHEAPAVLGSGPTRVSGRPGAAVSRRTGRLPAPLRCRYRSAPAR